MPLEAIMLITAAPTVAVASVGLTRHDCGKTSDGKSSQCHHLELLEHVFPPVVLLVAPDKTISGEPPAL
jgi:hypothetical protein